MKIVASGKPSLQEGSLEQKVAKDDTRRSSTRRRDGVDLLIVPQLPSTHDIRGSSYDLPPLFVQCGENDTWR